MADTHHPTAPSSSFHTSISSLAGHDDDLMLSLLAGQAAVDVDREHYTVLNWEDVEQLKKELALAVDRLNLLTLRHEREQKILTAARTLDRLHVGHKRMSKQTMEELQTAEKRAASAEKEMYTALDKESDLRRRLNEHYASTLSWESRRLQTLTALSADRGDLFKGKERERELDRQTNRLEQRVAELQELITDAGEREAGVAAELRAMGKELEAERNRVREQTESTARLNAQLEDLRTTLGAKEEEIKRIRSELDQSNETLSSASVRNTSDLEAAGMAREVLVPLLALSLTHDDPPPDQASLDTIAQLVRDEFEGLEAQLRETKSDSNAVQERLESELERMKKEKELGKRREEEMEKRWGEEKEVMKSKLTSLTSQSQRTKSIESNTSINQETTLAHLQNLWTLLPSQTTTTLFPSTPNVSSSLSFSNPTHPDEALLRSSRAAHPSSTPTDPDFPALLTSYRQGNGPAAYPGIQAFSDRVRALVEDGRVLLEKTAKYKRERDIHKSNSERAQRLVMESKAALETYHRQVRVLEQRLAVAEQGDKVSGQSFEKYNELENEIALLKKDKRRVEHSLNAQIEACESLSEANEALSMRAMTVANEASQEKRAVQTRLEAEIERLRLELEKTQEDLDDHRAKEMRGPVALLDELNSLQDEVQRLRAQLRAAQAAKQ